MLLQFRIGYVDDELPPICHPVGMRIHDWTGFAVLPVIVMTIVELWRGHGGSSLGWALAALLLGVATRYLALRFPSPMPHRLRWSLLVPRRLRSGQREAPVPCCSSRHKKRRGA